MQRIAVIDYGMGNLRSVAKALEYAGGGDVIVCSDSATIASADRVVFPGQGAIRDCMRELRSRNLIACLHEAMSLKPFLGICLGQQALMEFSEEHAGTRGFGMFGGTVKRFSGTARDPRTGSRLKVPHMGWNQVRFARSHALWHGIDNGEWFYFVHSFYIAPQDVSLMVGQTDYGVTFASAIARKNLFAVQFHPEKSAAAGLTLLRNFIAWGGDA